MGYGNIYGTGKHSTRIQKAKELKLKALSYIQLAKPTEQYKYSRRLSRKQKIDAIYSEVYFLVNSGKLNPSYGDA